MRRLLVFLTLLSLPMLAAQESLGVRFDPFNKPSGSVNVFSGSFSNQSTDVVVNCAEPIAVSRWYSSSHEKDGHVGTWTLQKEEVHVEIRPEGREMLIWWHGDDGSRTAFEGPKNWTYTRTKRKPLRWDAKIVVPYSYTNLGGDELSAHNSLRAVNLEWHYAGFGFTLTMGDGEQRIFSLYGKRPSMTRVEKRKNSRPVRMSFRLSKVIRPNGNKVHYSYDSNNRVTEIKSTNSSGTVTFGWARFEYSEPQEGRRQTDLTTSDCQSCRYIFNLRKLKIRKKMVEGWLLEQVHLPDGQVEHYGHLFYKSNLPPFAITKHKGTRRNSLHLSYYLNGKNEVAGKEVHTRDSYRNDPRHGRVLAEERPTEADGSLVKVAQYIYGYGNPPIGDPYSLACKPEWHRWVKVFDANLNSTFYHYDRKDRLVEIHRYLDGPRIPRKEKFIWSDKKDREGNLIGRSLLGENDQTLLHHGYCYDGRGNVTGEYLLGNLCGEGSQRWSRWLRYTNDGFNNLTIDRTGKRTVKYEYLPGTNLVKAKLVSEGGRVRERQFFHYDDNRQVVLAIEDDGADRQEGSLRNVTYRRITATHNRGDGLPESVEEKYLDLLDGAEQLLQRTFYHYDERNLIIQEDVYDGSDTFCYSVYREYDAGGRIIRSTNPLGEEELFTYDDRGNLIEHQGPRDDYVTKHTYDFADRRIRTEKIGEDGTHIAIYHRYDVMGRLISEVDMCGNETSYEYDALGRMIEEVKPPIRTPEGWESPVIRREYDALDRVIKEVDGRGNATLWTYNARGQVTTVRYQDDTLELMTYDIEGRMVSHTSRTGIKSLYTYDYRDRQTSVERYSSDGELLSRHESVYKGDLKVADVDGNGVRTAYAYDGAGRLIEQVHGDARLTFEYDSLGRKSRECEWFGYADDEYTATTWEYDYLGRVTREEIQDAAGVTLSRSDYTYDEDGNRITEVSWVDHEERNVTQFEYDLMGNLTSITDPLGHITYTRYERAAQFEGYAVMLEMSIDPLGNQTLIYHDPHGNRLRTERLNSVGNPLSQTDSFFDLASNRVQQKHRVITPGRSERLVISRWEYDAANHISLLEEGVGTPQYKVTRFRYNPDGELERVIRPDGQIVSCQYDGAGRVARRTAPGIDYTYEYDGNDNIISVHSPEGDNHRSYDQNNRPVDETLSTGLKLSYTYDRQGRRTGLFLPDHSSVRYTYGPAHLRQVSRHAPSGELVYRHRYLAYDLEGKKLREETVGLAGDRGTEWDSMGRISSITAGGYRESDIRYDAVGNLLSATTFDNEGCVEAAFTYDDLYQISREEGISSHHYVHDSLHNRVQYDDEAWEVDALNQLRQTGRERLSYDPQGCIISREREGGSVSYSYDGFNRLVAVENSEIRITFTYDSFDRRLSKSVCQKTLSGCWEEIARLCFLFDNRMEVGAVAPNSEVVEFRALGTGVGAEIGAAVAIELDRVVYVPSHDHRGCVTGLSDLRGQVAASYRYTAFGECQVLQGEDLANPWLFCSKRFDAETGLTNFGRRYYDSRLGRWITPDPKGYEEGPNLFAYVFNSPLASVDLWGEFSLTLSFKGRSKQPTRADCIRSCNWGVGRVIEMGAVHLCTDEATKRSLLKLACQLQGKPYEEENYFQKPSSFRVGDGEPSRKLRHRFVNGIMNSQNEALKTARTIREDLNMDALYVTHVPTHGFVGDGLRAGAEYFGCPIGDCVDQLEQDIKNDLNELDEDGILALYPHSRGTMVTDYALDRFPADVRNRMIVVNTFGGPIWIERCKARRVNNYCSTRDGVAMLARMRHWWHRGDYNTMILRNDGFQFIDHAILGDTYGIVLPMAIRDVEARYQK